jgi:lysozyme family protein
MLELLQSIHGDLPLVASLLVQFALIFVLLRMVQVVRETIERTQTVTPPTVTPWIPPSPQIPPTVSQPAKPPPPLPPISPSKQPIVETAYDKMWEAMQILPQHEAAIVKDANKVFVNKARYQGIADKTRVAWFVIGILDMMEAGGGCDAHLHNGDSLKTRTIHVPAGRPPAPEEPPFTWEQSAEDALRYEGFDKVLDWTTINAIAGAFEKYNGMGYHNKGVPSPYLWSFSNQYTAGKFVADHVYDPHSVSEQAGALPILKALMALDPSIQIKL